MLRILAVSWVLPDVPEKSNRNHWKISQQVIDEGPRSELRKSIPSSKVGVHIPVGWSGKLQV